jgi:hypothetical protein
VERVFFNGDGGDDELGVEPDVDLVDFIQADGGDGNDDLVAGQGDDELFGGSDDDVLRGAAGDDTLEGEAGDDRIDGGEGADPLTGGTGADTFTCDGADSLLDLEPEDIVDGCGAGREPAPPALPDPPASPRPPAPRPPASAPVVPPAPSPPADGGGAPARPQARAFTRPRISLTRVGLRVTLRNTSARDIRVAVGARERGRRYRTKRKVIRAGARATITLKAPRRVLRSAKRRRAVVTVTDLASGEKVTVRKRP